MKLLRSTLLLILVGAISTGLGQIPADPTNTPVAPSNLVEQPLPSTPPAGPSQAGPTNSLVPPQGAAMALTNALSPEAPKTAADTNTASPQQFQTAIFTPPPGDLTNGTSGLRLNFRKAPLEMVLNYLSDAAGFVIVPEVDVRGLIDVWSNRPVSKDEAVDLLNSVLNKNGYAILRNEKTLTVVSRDEAKKRDIPVRSGSDPAKIPKNDEIVTQIIPIRFINASQLTRDLQPLLPAQASLTANDAGNALVLTDSQAHIKRVAEIVKALDTALSSVSSVRVFPLKFADAKALASVVKELFTPQQDQSRNQQGPGRFFNFMRGRDGGGGPPGMPGMPGMGGEGGRAPAPKVLAVADERSNSLVVSAPEDQMPIVEDLVKQVDTDVEEVTELRVFRLKFADAQEMADLITSLFPDTRTDQSRGQIQFGGGRRFGGFPFGGGRGVQAGAGDTSTRLQKQTRVSAVPDLRTGSVVVSAARDLMQQIAGMIDELDADPAKKQKVYVFSVENSDPQSVQDVLQNLFPNQNTGGYGSSYGGSSRNSGRGAGSQLNNRASQMQNQNYGNSGGFGNSFGGGGSGGRTGR